MVILELDAFIRTVGVNQKTPHNFFLGAGVSVTSGLPAVGTLVWEWKRRIFLSNNPGLEDQFSELSLPKVRERLQKWFDDRGGYPAIDSPEEYSYYIEKCYPIKESRRIFFEETVRRASPFIGYKLLCLLAEADFLRSAWTTNFDGLVAKAAAGFRVTPLEVGIDSQNRLGSAPQKGQLLSVSMHGDYRYDLLKNTEQELQEQEKSIRSGLISYMRSQPFVVCGYSGRDKSVMDTFQEAYSQRGAGALYWCGYGDEIPPNVLELIEYARSNGHNAFFVPTYGFDDLMQRLSSFCLENEFLTRAKALMAEGVKDPEKTSFKLDDGKIIGLLKSNAFEIICPKDLIELSLKKWPDGKAWKWLNDISKKGRICAVPFKGKVLCLGILDEIKSAFQEYGIEQVQRIPISEADLKYEDGVVVSLLRRSLTFSIAQTHLLETDGRDEIWINNSQQVKRIDAYICDVYPSVILALRKMAGYMYLVLKPSLHLSDQSGKEIPKTIRNQVKNEILGYQHNKEFNAALDDWRKRIFPEADKNDSFTEYEFPLKSGSHFEFKIRRVPIFGGIKSVTGSGTFDPPRIAKQRGVLLSEPALLFSNRQSSGYVKDTHPLRGIISNRPYDFSLTSQGFSPGINIGVVCPENDGAKFLGFLTRGQYSQKPASTEQDYLIEYPGFSNAFGLPLRLPQPSDADWITISEIDKTLDDKAGTRELARILTTSIDSLSASSKPHVILLYIPARWKRFRQYQDQDDSFDLHDFVKAYSVQKGVATQFIEEDTLSNSYQCRIWWWLSVAIYAKSMRTPWVIDGLDTDTAYVGLGFSVRENQERGKNVVLGCGHIYNSHGEGLRYRLSPIQEPILIRGNPFMSYEDSRRLGETVRQLFYESSMKLPRRVVLHKQTYFRKEEMEGLRAGLSGINSVEMLEINYDSALRYVSSIRLADGKFDDDRFPIRRGTALKIDDYSALLWVHGVTDAVNPKLKYFKGKRRIPTPIRVTRYAGNSDIVTIGNEILALSKMDWNSADMYSQLPATIQSSRQIARIGSLLQRFGPTSYDYRLFI